MATAKKAAAPRRAAAGYTSAGVNAVPVTTSTTTLFASGSSQTQHARTITNDSASAGAVFVKFGGAASATDFTVSLAAGQYYEFPQPLYVGLVTAVAASTATARCTSY